MRRKTSERIKEGGKMQRRQRWEVKEEQAEEKETVMRRMRRRSVVSLIDRTLS